MGPLWSVADRKRGAIRGGARLLLAAAALLPLTGCSSIPDELNPSEWYRSVSNWFQSDEDRPVPAKPEAGIVAAQPVDPNQPFPKLSSVPEPPKEVIGPAERKAAVQELERDRQAARRADAGLRDGAPPAAAGMAQSTAQSAALSGAASAPESGASGAAPAGRPGALTRPGVRYAIPPRPPVAPPQPLSVQQGALRSPAAGG